MNFFNLDPTMIDPNVVYLALVFGLWVAVTSLYAPGTGVIEGLAVLVLIGTVLLLGMMPTNWWAVLLIVVGLLGFMVMPFVRYRLAILAPAGLILQVIGALFLFVDRPISWLIIALTIGLPLMYHHLILMPILETAQQAEPDEDTRVIGARGRVTQAINPIGAVRVGSEIWTATSDRPLEVGDEIIVLEREGLQLLVEGVKHKHTGENQYEEASQ